MTISEQLQFSVLSAPVATLDRRTLSQAWYSALYGNGEGRAAKHPAPLPSSQSGGFRRSAPEPAQAAAGSPRAQTRARPHAERDQIQANGAAAERRAPRSALARRIERAFLRPRDPSSKASFTLDDDDGRVHVVLHSRGAQVQLIAICPPKARARVAAALAQARYALALRGIDLEADMRAAAAC